MAVHPGSWCLGGKRIARQAHAGFRGAFAPPERSSHSGRGSVSIVWRAVVCGVRNARGEWKGRGAEETYQNIARTMRKPCEDLANNTLLTPCLRACLHAASRLRGGWQCRDWCGVRESLIGWGTAGRRKRTPKPRPA
jgi:hypothetical protein